MSLQKEFEALGCWSAPTEEEHISVYGLDFDNCYIIFTDLDGKTPVDALTPKRPLLPPATMTATLLCGARS